MLGLSDKPIRLRDFFRVRDLYFSVVGYKNYDYVKAFLRYAPGKGGRFKDGREYKKLGYEEAVEIGRDYFSEKEGIFRVKKEVIEEVFKPEERLEEVMDEDVKRVVEFFSGIPRKEMGVTGSRLIGLKGSESDIDFVMYGKYWHAGREKIRKGIETGRISEPDEDTWDFIYKKRKPALTYQAFLIHERRKYHRAFIGSTYFDLLYVRGYEELSREIPEEKGEKMGKQKVFGEVIDDRFVFDYPAYYPLKNSRIFAVLSFTHTYAGQAFRGERIEAYGDLEIIRGKPYLVVGTKRETPDEYIVSRTLIEKSGVGEYLNERV